MNAMCTDDEVEAFERVNPRRHTKKNLKDVAKVDYEKYGDKKEDALRPMRRKVITISVKRLSQTSRDVSPWPSLKDN